MPRQQARQHFCPAAANTTATFKASRSVPSELAMQRTRQEARAPYAGPSVAQRSLRCRCLAVMTSDRGAPLLSLCFGCMGAQRQRRLSLRGSVAASCGAARRVRALRGRGCAGGVLCEPAAGTLRAAGLPVPATAGTPVRRCSCACAAGAPPCLLPKSHAHPELPCAVLRSASQPQSCATRSSTHSRAAAACKPASGPNRALWFVAAGGSMC